MGLARRSTPFLVAVLAIAALLIGWATAGDRATFGNTAGKAAGALATGHASNDMTPTAGGSGSGKGGGGHGGVPVPPPAPGPGVPPPPPVVPAGKVPADWPQAVAVPTVGQIQGANRAPGIWVLAILARGDSATVRRSLVTFYQARGFTLDPNAAVPTILTSPGYTITIHMAPRDHSPTKTNVVFQLTKNP